MVIDAVANDSILTFSLMIRRRLCLIGLLLQIKGNKFDKQFGKVVLLKG